MPDIIDQGNEAAEIFLDAALRNQQHAAKLTTPAGIGICLCCGVDVEGVGRWCGPPCRDEWEREQSKRVR